MSEREERSAPTTGEGAGQAIDESQGIQIAVTEEVKTQDFVTVEVLKRAETEFVERERTEERLQVTVAAVTLLAAVAVAVVGIVGNVASYAVIPATASAILGLLTALLAANVSRGPWPFGKQTRTRLEPELPTGLAALRDRLAVERQEALASVYGSARDPRSENRDR